MEIIHSVSQCDQLACMALMNFPQTRSLGLENLCFFDIETTGLSPDISSLYLIGCSYIEGNELHSIQWFADNYISEKAILEAFSEFIKPFSLLVSYNGRCFDIKYLNNKYRKYSLDSPFDTKCDLDFYAVFRPYRKFFAISSLKLSAVESILGIGRRDSYTGKDCIDLYSRCIQGKYTGTDNFSYCKEQLLLHNHEDIVGTFRSSRFCSLVTPIEQPELFVVDYQSSNQLVLKHPLSAPIVTPLNNNTSFYNLAVSENTIQISLPFFTGVLYHFYKDYKNYYYLPEEDEAIHKSVAAFVDSDHRKKASAANCYTKKESTFLQLYHWKKAENTFHGKPVFFNKERTSAFLEWDGVLSGDYLQQLTKIS